MVRRDALGVLVALGRHDVDRAARDLAEARHAVERAEGKLAELRRVRAEVRGRHERAMAAERERFQAGCATAGDLVAASVYTEQALEQLERADSVIVAAEAELRHAREREARAVQALQETCARRELLAGRAHDAEIERRERRELGEQDDLSPRAASNRRERGSA